MKLSEQADKHRVAMLRKLKRKYRDGTPQEVLEAQRVIVKYQEERAGAKKHIARLEAEACPVGLCFRCFYDKGIKVPLVPMSSEDTDYDCFRCGQCGAQYNELIDD